MLAALTAFRSWAGKRKRLLAGVVGVAVKTAGVCVPGVGLAAELLADLAEKATESVLDPESNQPLTQEQLTQINTWLETLSSNYAGLLDRLEQMPLVIGGTIEQLTQTVESAIQGREDLLREFDSCLVQVRKQTLSLGIIERKLDEHFHVGQQMNANLEDIKDLLANSPMMGEWADFRSARPEAMKAVNDADRHFLAGRKEQGVAVLLRLLEQRCVGSATLAHHLGLVELSRGDPSEAHRHLQQSAGQAPGPANLMGARSRLSMLSRRGMPTWRTLPRGFRVGKYRIESEIGRGGMASVYRAEAIAGWEKERVVAVKVPAPALMSDLTTRVRFEQEIGISQRLSQDRHPNIVRVLDYELFDDPFTRQELYALVMEYVEGMSLAQHLASSRELNKPLEIREVLRVMEAVCSALEHAHSQGVYHRDLKPQNIMVTKELGIKLMDFGIARVLDDSQCGATQSGQIVGTHAYLPPELLAGGRVVDARTDIYMAGTLLLELLTGDLVGDPRSRQDCPPAWLKLITESTSRFPHERPESALAFRTRLKLQTIGTLSSHAVQQLDCRQRIWVPIHGRWLSKPANDPTAKWESLSSTPSYVQLEPGMLYGLSACSDAAWAALPCLADVSSLYYLALELDSLTEHELEEYVSKLTSLRILDLRSGGEDVRCTKLYGLSNLENLEELFLDQCEIDETAFENFPWSIRHLSLCRCEGFEAYDLVPLADLTNLRILDISGCDCLADEGLEYIRELTNLEKLDLSGCDCLTDKGLKYLQTLSNLKYLNLDYCDKLTGEGIDSLEASLPNCKIHR